jgi:hypothetical protein
MRRILIVAVVALSTILLGAGVADAQPATYKVSRSWLLAYVDGTPTVKPHIEDDVVEVRCQHGDRMKGRYQVNDRRLVAGAWRRIDGTGIQIQPEFAARTERLRITITCRRG